jgi:hypothetical protein
MKSRSPVRGQGRQTTSYHFLFFKASEIGAPFQSEIVKAQHSGKM